MTTFFLDLWQDLRTKRLWPVAVALVAATVAVPLMLVKPASTPAPSTAVGTASNASKLPTVSLDASSVSGSHLDVFDEKNPFNALSDPAKDGNAAGNATDNVGDDTGGAASTAGGSASSGAGSAVGSGGGGGGGGSAPTGPDGKPLTPGTHYFTYTADVRFGTRSNMETYKSIGRLDLIPDGSSPVLAFMGARGASTAVFFIADPAFEVDGEGTCEPSPDNCMFLSLRKDSEHNEATLTAQNGKVEYTVELTGLHVKFLDENEALGNTTPENSNSKTRAKRSLMSLPALGLAKR